MRIAWTGPVGDAENGNAAAMGGLLLMALVDLGAEVDIYLPGSPADIPAPYRQHPRVTVLVTPEMFKWNRWYSRNRVSAFLSSTLARSLVHVRIGLSLLRRHREQPYVCIFQMAQTELFAIGWLRRWLPPIVVHPCTSAAQELY